MTLNEFETWIEYHMARFTGLRSWLGKMPQSDREAVYDAWRKVLTHTDLDDGKAASDAMFEDESLQPRGFDKHPAVIRSIAAKRSSVRPSGGDRPRYVDGEEVFRCLDCKDTGYRSIWHRKTVKAVRAGKAIAKGWYYTAACACLCESGQKWKWLKPFEPLYDVVADKLSDIPPREQIEAVPVKAKFAEFGMPGEDSGCQPF